VKPGRARNHLVPLKMARYATADRLDEAAARRASWADQTETIVTADDTGETDAARVALNILTGSKLVVKRIASKDTKNPRVPVDAAALVAEVSARNMFFLRGISAREREIFLVSSRHRFSSRRT